MRLLMAAILAVLFGTAEARQSVSGSAGTQWRTVNAGDGYAAEGNGDTQTDAGAKIVVRSVKEAAGKYGGAISSIDATSLRNHRVILSSNLKADTGTKGAAIWLRADGAAGKLKFVTSAAYPVTDGQGPAYREIAMSVPSNAASLVFGVVLTGNGSIEATNFRIRVDQQETTSGAVATAEQVLDAAIAIVKENALNASAVNWDTATTKIRTASQAASKPEDAYPVIRELLSMLGDGHSFFATPEVAGQHAAMGTATSAPVVKLLSQGVGYVLLPGFVGLNDEEALKFSGSIAANIKKLSSKATVGWIIDLRDNGGGNMWPMLAALKPLLGNEKLGSFKSSSGTSNTWLAGDRIGGGSSLPISVDLSGAKVAVLLGTRTSSSGEAVAVAFHGRPRTRSFGQATSGQSNSNSTYTLPDGSQIYLTTAVDVDRNGVVFGGKMEPDEPTAVTRGARDPALEAATAWLVRREPGGSASSE